MMPNFAGVEKFFAHMTFKASGAAGHSCRKQFSTRQILKNGSSHFNVLKIGIMIMIKITRGTQKSEMHRSSP